MVYRVLHGLLWDTPWKTNMDPENHWLVEENTLPGGQDVRVYVSFRECISLINNDSKICSNELKPPSSKEYRKTQRRTPKTCGHWFAAVIRPLVIHVQGILVPWLIQPYVMFATPLAHHDSAMTSCLTQTRAAIWDWHMLHDPETTTPGSFSATVRWCRERCFWGRTGRPTTGSFDRRFGTSTVRPSAAVSPLKYTGLR